MIAASIPTPISDLYQPAPPPPPSLHSLFTLENQICSNTLKNIGLHKKCFSGVHIPC